MNMVLKRYLACQTFSKCQPYSNKRCLSICTYTYEFDAENQLHNCICGTLSKMKVLTCEIASEKNDWVAIALMVLHHNVNYTKLHKIAIGLLAQKTSSSTTRFLKGYFRNTFDWYFVQILGPQFLRIAVTLFNMRNYL